jgi:hypothetical protein
LRQHGTLACYINYLSSFSEKIQGLSQRWNVYPKGYTNRGATRFHPVPHIVHYIYKWYAPNPWCLSRSLCWWHLLYMWSIQKETELVK